jgi:hypothetical protein
MLLVVPSFCRRVLPLHSAPSTSTTARRPPPPPPPKKPIVVNPYRRPPPPPPPRKSTTMTAASYKAAAEALDKVLPIAENAQELAVWAQACPTLYADEKTTARIKASTGNTPGYEKDKKDSVDRFFKILSSHPHANISQLADIVECPETLQGRFRLVLMCQNGKSLSQKRVLNMACCIFVLNLQKLDKRTNQFYREEDLATPEEKAQAQYQPSVIDLKIRHVFAFLKSESVFIEKKDLNSMPGSFDALTKDRFAETLKHRPDYAQRKSAPVDVLASEKMRDPIFGFKPFRQSLEKDSSLSGVTDITRMMAVDVGCCFMPRGKKEPHSLTRSSFIFGIQKGGEFHGRGTLTLKDFKGNDKSQKVTLANPWVIDHSGYLKVYDDPNDPFSLFKLVKHWVTTQLDPLCRYYGVEDCPFFWRRAPDKVLKQRRKAVANGDMSQNFELDNHRNQRWGLDYFTSQVRVVAIKCDFEEAHRWTMRSCRRTGITNMSSDANVATSVVNITGRHKSSNTSALYQQQDEAALVQRAKAVQYNPNRRNIPNPKRSSSDTEDSSSDDEKKPRAKSKKSKKSKKKPPVLELDDSSSEDDSSSSDDSRKKRRRKKKKKKQKTAPDDALMAFMKMQQQQLQQFQMTGMGTGMINPFSAMMNPFGGGMSSGIGSMMPMMPLGARFNPLTGSPLAKSLTLPPAAKFDPMTGKRLSKKKQPPKKHRESMIQQLDSSSSDSEEPTKKRRESMIQQLDSSSSDGEESTLEPHPLKGQQMSQELVVYSQGNSAATPVSNQGSDEDSSSDSGKNPVFDFEKHSQEVFAAQLRGEGPDNIIYPPVLKKFHYR